MVVFSSLCEEVLPSPSSSSLINVCDPPSSPLQVFYHLYRWQKGLVSRHSQVNREGQMQAMAIEAQYKLSAGMGVYLGLVFKGKIIPKIVQNNTCKKGGRLCGRG